MSVRRTLCTFWQSCMKLRGRPSNRGLSSPGSTFEFEQKCIVHCQFLFSRHNKMRPGSGMMGGMRTSSGAPPGTGIRPGSGRARLRTGQVSSGPGTCVCVCVRVCVSAYLCMSLCACISSSLTLTPHTTTASHMHRHAGGARCSTQRQCERGRQAHDRSGCYGHEDGCGASS